MHDSTNLLFAEFAAALFIHRANLFLGYWGILLEVLFDKVTGKEETSNTTDDENANQRKDEDPNIDHL